MFDLLHATYIRFISSTDVPMFFKVSKGIGVNLWQLLIKLNLVKFNCYKKSMMFILPMHWAVPTVESLRFASLEACTSPVVAVGPEIVLGSVEGLVEEMCGNYLGKTSYMISTMIQR